MHLRWLRKNEETRKAIAEARKGNGKKFHSTKALFAELAK
jgi:antitoxin component of RelBE/YafQ-DinJ toxin-antitoxin module